MQKTLVLIKDTDFAFVEREVKRRAVIGWQDKINLRPIDARKLSKKEDINRILKNTDKLMSLLTDTDYEKLIIQQGLPIDSNLLKEQISVVREVPTALTLARVIEEELKNKDLHWHIHALTEWKKSSLQYCSPDAWVQQFAEFDIIEIGRNLLKDLSVISDQDLRNTFKVSDEEQIGLRVLHAYVEDNEPGSSSIAIKNVLEHMYHPNKVVKVDLTNPEQIFSLKADILYIYEDGLWSGVELVRRLEKICSSQSFQNSNLELFFRFGATSDAGLSAARIFSKTSGQGRLRFGGGSACYHFKFFKSGTDSCFEKLQQFDVASVRSAIDSSIEPFAFRINDVWEGTRSSAVEVCSQIGAQLVEPFLRRKYVSKTTTNADASNTDIKIDPTDISKWVLGACGFASTIVFSSSVPKPVLPLMWLAGDVTLNGKTIRWKPLFWDARRMEEGDAI